MVIDITEIRWTAPISLRPGGVGSKAAEHGVAAFEAIQATGLTSLLPPAWARLMAIGREIARDLSK